MPVKFAGELAEVPYKEAILQAPIPYGNTWEYFKLSSVSGKMNTW